MSEDTQPVEWVKFYPEKWMAGTVGLSAAEIGVYISICAYNHSSGNAITIRTLERRFRDEDVAAVVEELRLDGKVFVEDRGSDGVAVWNNRSIQSHAEATKFKASYQERSRKGVEARKAKLGKPKKPAVVPEVNEKKTSGTTQTDRQTDRQTDKEKEARENAPLPSKEKSYAFDGKVVRLTTKDFNRWVEAYPYIEDLAGELAKIDNWLAKSGIAGAWFNRVSGMLRKSNEEERQHAEKGLDDAIDLVEGVE